MKKYKLTKVTKEWLGVTLYQIEALRSFGAVSKGEKGGYISKEDNLSQDGDAWVYGNAWVSGDARVYGDAWVYGNARVYGNAWVYGNARVYGNAWVSGDARVYGNAWVYGNARVSGDAWVSGELKLIGGSFYHTKEKSETIEKIEVSEDYEILARDPKLAEEDEESSLSGKEVTVTLDGKSYTAVIK
jgi:hypothetical protein